MNQVVIVAAILTSMLTVASSAEAAFERSRQVIGNTISTAVLQAPSSLTATAGCEAGAPKVTVSWTMTASTFADGYDLYVGSVTGGPYSLVAHVTERTTVTAADTSLDPDTAYHYVARATAFEWESINSTEASATTAPC